MIGCPMVYCKNSEGKSFPVRSAFHVNERKTSLLPNAVTTWTVYTGYDVYYCSRHPHEGGYRWSANGVLCSSYNELVRTIERLDLERILLDCSEEYANV